MPPEHVQPCLPRRQPPIVRAIVPDCTLPDPEVEDRLIDDEDGFLSLSSPFLELQFDNGETIAYYFNQIALTLAENTKCRLGTHDWQDRFQHEMPLHINLQALCLLASADQKNDTRIVCSREIIRSYASKLHGLIVDIACKVAESLGLGNYSFMEWPCQFRINKYYFTEETVGSRGVQIHTDSGFITVLQEDESVGGLEVMDKSGSFVAVDPVPGTFLVNLGDVATAWSNGRLHNVKHQVQCKEGAPRVSIALFLLAPKDDKVEPPAAFVDSKHPRLYKTFNYDDYRKIRFSSGLQAGEALSLLATQKAPMEA